jgi:hypothetical protein
MVSRPGILASRRAWREGGNGGRRLGVARRRLRQCLNRALDRDVAVTAKMPSYHGAPRPACVRAALRTDRRSAACTAHVRRNDGEKPRCLGRGVSLGKARGRGAHNLGRRDVGRRDVTAHSVAGPFSICWALVWTRFTPKILIEVDKTMNTKIVDLTTPYNFHIGHLGFFSTDLQEWLANFECHSVSVNRRYCHLAKFSPFSTQNLKR